MMVRRSVWLVLALALALRAARGAQTVAVAQLSGTVADETGGALPGADSDSHANRHRDDPRS